MKENNIMFKAGTSGIILIILGVKDVLLGVSNEYDKFSMGMIFMGIPLIGISIFGQFRYWKMYGFDNKLKTMIYFQLFVIISMPLLLIWFSSEK